MFHPFFRGKDECGMRCLSRRKCFGHLGQLPGVPMSDTEQCRIEEGSIPREYPAARLGSMERGANGGYSQKQCRMLEIRTPRRTGRLLGNTGSVRIKPRWQEDRGQGRYERQRR